MKHLKWAVAGLLLSVGLLIPASSQGGTYTIKVCEPGNPDPISTALGVFSSNAAGMFLHSSGTGNSCSPQSNVDWTGLDVGSKDGVTPASGDLGRWKFSAPSGLGFSAVSFGTWTNTSEPAIDWRSNYILHNNGSNAISIPYASDVIQRLSATVPNGGVRSNFEANLKCVGSTCPSWNWGFFTLMANIQLTVKDSTNPNAFRGSTGTLYSGGTVSGTKTAVGYGTDAGSGVRRVYLIVNNALVNWTDGAGTAAGVSCNPSSPTYNAYQPCPGVLEGNFTVNTAAAPFVNGANQVKFCALDYSGNNFCEAPTTVNVFN